MQDWGKRLKGVFRSEREHERRSTTANAAGPSVRPIRKPPPPYAATATAAQLVSRSTSTTSQPPQPPPAVQRTERFGLFCLHDSSKADESGHATGAQQYYPVDIIAVHGLNGDAYTTWTHPASGTLWLQTILPRYLPGCSVYTYGYPSQILFNKSLASVREFAEGLLTSVRDLQAKNQQKTKCGRPLIFVCHSLGGIVCKQVGMYFLHLLPCWTWRTLHYFPGLSY